MLTAEEIIQKLELLPLEPEGGFFRRTFRSSLETKTPHGTRSIGTAIYYLVTPTQFSKLHILKYSEIYHFYLGDPLHLMLIHQDGSLEKVILGNDLLAGQVPQFVIEPGVWQGSYLETGPHGFALVGATCAPGFEFEDFILGARSDLIAQFPAHESVIEKLT